MGTGPDDVPQHEVLRVLASARADLAAVNEAAGWSLSDDETRAALIEAVRLQAVARAAYLKLLAASAERDVPQAGPSASTPGSGRARAETCTWLAATARMTTGRVRVDLREAIALDPDIGTLRTVGADLAAGQVTPEHAAVAVRALKGIPAKILQERRADVDALLTGHARTFDPATATTLGRHLLVTIAPDRADHFDTEAHLRRELYLGVDSTGMGVLRGQLDPATAAHLKAVLDHLSAPHRGPV